MYTNETRTPLPSEFETLLLSSKDVLILGGCLKKKQKLVKIFSFSLCAIKLSSGCRQLYAWSFWGESTPAMVILHFGGQASSSPHDHYILACTKMDEVLALQSFTTFNLPPLTFISIQFSLYRIFPQMYYRNPGGQASSSPQTLMVCRKREEVLDLLSCEFYTPVTYNGLHFISICLLHVFGL